VSVNKDKKSGFRNEGGGEKKKYIRVKSKMKNSENPEIKSMGVAFEKRRGLYKK
jgi:hypothetical protein